ncbi:MAG: DUF3999 family protein [Deltaproteobacteria bacterium]|nr:DUF3999 family protein [Deltaproteobacteria bacterium]
MRRVGLPLLVVLVSSAAGADFSTERWRFRREVRAADGDPESLASIEADDAVYRRARPDLADLRLTDGDAREIPAVRHEAARAERAFERRPATIIDRAVTQDASTAVADLGPDDLRGRHNAVEIGLAGDESALGEVLIEASEDNAAWQTVGSGGIYRFRSAAGATTSYSTVSYPLSSRRYVRVTVWNKTGRALAVDSLSVEEESTSAGELRRWTSFTRVRSAEARSPERTTARVFDLGTGGRPIAGVTIDTTSRSFHRVVSIDTADALEPPSWEPLGTGGIFRVRVTDRTIERLRIDLPERHARYLRVLVDDGDDRPLDGLELGAVSYRPVRLVFRRGRGPLVLWYGSAGARAPRYDLGAQLEIEERKAALPARLGPPQRNARWVRPGPSGPFTERHPIVLWASLLAAVAVLLVLLVRGLRRAEPQGQ